MGRKGKQKDYITATEWKDDYGGKQVGRYGSILSRLAIIPRDDVVSPRGMEHGGY